MYPLLRAVPVRISMPQAQAVLEGLIAGSISAGQAQQWASFVRWGFVEGASGPIRPLDIVYDQTCEDAIVEVVGRLDQIGDAIDGEAPDANELASLVTSLTD